MTALSYPDINGVRVSWAEIEFRLANSRQYGLGMKEINYSAKLEPGMVRGTGRKVIGRTGGQEDCSASFTMLKAEAMTFLRYLGAGYGLRSFDISVSFANGADTTTDELIGCRITNVDQAHAQSTDGLVVKFDLSVMKVKLAGLEIS